MQLTQPKCSLMQGISMVLHDFKSPVAAILANAEFLESLPRLEEESLVALRDIGEGARLLDRMIMNLLDVCRSEDGALHPCATRVDLAEVLGEVSHEMARRLVKSRMSFLQEVDPDATVVWGDRDLIRRVLENLVDNALKHSPALGVVSVSARRFDLEVEVGVADQGPGIPSDCCSRIFESDVRLERDVLSNVGSSRGLGLAFCRSAVEAHGGRIWVDENLPRGSIFRLRLPVPAG